MNGNAPFSKPFFTSKVDGLNRLDWVGMLRFRHELGHNAPFPIVDLGSKASKKMYLSKRKFVIRHAGIQIQPPSSCRPCPFGAYGGKAEDKR